MKASNLLTKFKACPEAIEWASDKTVEEAWNTCHRGDWMLWFYQKLYPENLRQLTLAKAKCAETVKHLMSKESKEALEVAIAFAYGSASKEELDKAVRTAYATYAAAAYATYATYAAAYATYAAAAAYAAAREANQLEIANICRKYLTLEATHS